MPLGGRWLSGVACQGIELSGGALDGGGPTTSGGCEVGDIEFGAPFQRLAALGCE